MANYLYQTTLYTDTNNVIGLNTGQNTTDLNDYTNNFRVNTDKVDDITVAETTFQSNLTYTNFKALIVGQITWSDVKEANYLTHYVLYLLTDNPQ